MGGCRTKKDIEEHDIVIASHSLRFMKDIRSALSKMMDISEKDEEKLRSYLTEKLVEEDGVLWSKHKLRTAMVWWRKE